MNTDTVSRQEYDALAKKVADLEKKIQSQPGEIMYEFVARLSLVCREMKYTPEEVMQYVVEEDVKFIRMAFCDVYGWQRNVAVMASELPRAFEHGIAIDASAIDGFDNGEVRSDLFLWPDIKH